MKYQVQTVVTGRMGHDSDGLYWTPYRSGRLFSSQSAAQKLVDSIVNRWGGGESDVRIVPITDYHSQINSHERR